MFGVQFNISLAYYFDLNVLQTSFFINFAHLSGLQNHEMECRKYSLELQIICNHKIFSVLIVKIVLETSKSFFLFKSTKISKSYRVSKDKFQNSSILFGLNRPNEGLSLVQAKPSNFLRLFNHCDIILHGHPHRTFSCAK